MVHRVGDALNQRKSLWVAADGGVLQRRTNRAPELRRGRSLGQRRLDVVSKPKPSYNIDGQEVKWSEYLKQLDASIERIDEDLNKFEGPFEEVTVAYSGP